MRAIRLALSFTLLAASLPTEALAQVRAVRTGISSPASVPLLGAGLSSSFTTPLPLLSPSLSPSLSAPSISVAAAPTLQTLLSPASLNPTAAIPVAQAVVPLPQRVVAAKALTQTLATLPISAAPRAAAASFALLTGEASATHDDSLVVFAAASTPDTPPLLPTSLTPPRAPNPEAAKSVRRMMIGTAAMKTGMETVTLSIPLLALTALGGASMVASLMVAYGVSQAVFAGAAGSLSDRFSANKVLAGAIIAQAALVGVIVALGAASALSAATLLPLYILVGAAVGISETTRHSIPALVLGQNTDTLNRYNARLHISYEIAGVAGALAAGGLIFLAGPLWSLLLQPPAYLLAAYFFLHVKHAQPADATPTTGGLWTKIKAYVSDVKAGAKIVLGNVRLRWVALAFVLPQIVHRVFEGILIPVFAKSILEAEHVSAWLLTASNLGELLGAVLLLKFASRFKGPAVWVKYGALGLLLIWTLASTTMLPILLPLILVSSLSWAASDLSLRSEVQGTVNKRDQPRALSFLYSAFVLGSAAASFALGGLIDGLGMATALYWIGAVITALAVAVFIASRRLKR